jgi:hypothetical protein
METALLTNFRRASYNIIHNITTARTRKHVIEKFTKKHSMVYFGSVNQYRDEHRVVHGFTVSSTHNDNHYSVGTVDDYDVTIVDRSDALPNIDGTVKIYSWLIMAIDLHTKQDIPHLFIGANNHNTEPYNSLFTTYPMLRKVELGTFEDYDPEFTSRFNIYTQPSDSIEIEHLFQAKITRVLGAHFWPYSAELYNGVLYVYSDDNKTTQHTLDTMLENGLWMAHHLDSQIELV